MTGTITRVFDAYAAYLAIHETVCDALGVAAKDGPQLDLDIDLEQAIVGTSDPFAEQMIMFDQGQQNYVSVGASSRNESFIIPACLVVWSGDPGFVTSRTKAKAFFVALGDAIYASPVGSGDGKLNGGLGTPAWCWLTVKQGVPLNNKSGSGLMVPYDLNCVTRL